MRNIIVLFVSFISVSLFSIDHGLITGFEIGYNFDKLTTIEDSNYENNYDLSDSLSVKLQIGYRIEGFRIIGTYTNTMHPLSIDSFSPVRDRFRIDASYTFFNFKIGAYHWCDHHVVTQTDNRELFLNYGQRAVYISYYKEF